MSAAIRQTLRLFSRARAWHRGQERFAAAAELIARETGVEPSKVRAVLAGGFSSKETQARLAAWNGLRPATLHGAPVLISGPDPDFQRGEGRGVAPIPVETAIERAAAALARARARMAEMRAGK